MEDHDEEDGEDDEDDEDSSPSRMTRTTRTLGIGGGGRGGGAGAAARSRSSSSSSSSSSSEQQLDDEDGKENADQQENEQQQQQQQQKKKQHGGGGGLVPKTDQNSVPSLLRTQQQYRQIEFEKRKQKTRDSKISATLLHPHHSLAFGVWKTPNGDVNVCSKGIGIGHNLRNDVVDTLFKGIKNATPANSTFQHLADPFSGGVLSRRLLMSLASAHGSYARS
jgi:hypothetical protein